MPSQRDMKITTWNARGLNAPCKKRLVKLNLKSFDSDIILIQETKLNKDDAIKLDKMLGLWSSLFQEYVGASGGLGIFWNPRKVSLCCLYQCHNWISASIKSLKSDLQFILINVYGPINYGDKKKFGMRLVGSS